MFINTSNNKIGKTLIKPFISAFFCLMLQNSIPKTKQEIDRIIKEKSKTLLYDESKLKNCSKIA